MSNLSLTMPVFNQLHLTRRSLDSILEGAAQAHELVIVDNHSTDETPDYLLAFKKRAEIKGWTVKIITNSENRGVSAAFNQGIDSSEGRYIVFANNDTWLMPRWDEALVEAAGRLDADMIGAHFDETPFDDVKTPLKARRFVIRNRHKHSGEWASIVMLFKREVFEKVGPFDERYFVAYEDRDLRERMDRAHMKYFKTADCFIWHHSKGTRDAGQIRPGYEQESLAKFIEKWGFDPRTLENKKIYHYKRKWVRFKNKLGLF